MVVKKKKPVTPGLRKAKHLTHHRVTKKRPEKRLTQIQKRSGGRGNTGRITVRGRGGGAKRRLRLIDWKRDKRNIPARVTAIEHEPNRTANVALLVYPDGEKRYILAPQGLRVGDEVSAGEKVEVKPGNALPLAKIPVGMPIHNIELTPGRGAQLVRSAGNAAFISAKEGKFATIQLPSKETRLAPLDSFATIGQVGKAEVKTVRLGKAGKSRHRGRRPKVRGVAMHPGAHPHGGGEGRSGIGMPSPKSPWGKKTLGKKTRKLGKYSAKFIVERRK